MKKIAYAGTIGAYSYLAGKQMYPKDQLIAARNFEEVVKWVIDSQVDLGVLPIQNSLIGQIKEVNQLIINHKLSIIKDYWLPIHHCLLAKINTKFEDIKQIYSHSAAILQCQIFFDSNSNIQAKNYPNTALAAEFVSLEKENKHIAAIASSEAAQIFGLQILMSNLEDNPSNQTRFLACCKS